MPATTPDNASDTIFTVDTLLKYMGADGKALAVVRKIVQDACAPGMEPVRCAAVALAEQRWYDAGRIFHGLRGSVGTLGARRMVKAALELELAISETRIAEIPQLLAAFEREYQQVLSHADTWLAQHLPA